MDERDDERGPQSLIIAPEEAHHRIRISNIFGEGELCLVSGGQDSYLWVGTESSRDVMVFNGAETLRRLAKEILAEVGDE